MNNGDYSRIFPIQVGVGMQSHIGYVLKFLGVRNSVHTVESILRLWQVRECLREIVDKKGIPMIIFADGIWDEEVRERNEADFLQTLLEAEGGFREGIVVTGQYHRFGNQELKKVVSDKNNSQEEKYHIEYAEDISSEELERVLGSFAVQESEREVMFCERQG